MVTISSKFTKEPIIVNLAMLKSETTWSNGVAKCSFLDQSRQEIYSWRTFLEGSGRV